MIDGVKCFLQINKDHTGMTTIITPLKNSITKMGKLPSGMSYLVVFSHVCVSAIMNILDNKAAGIDGLSGIFIKDGEKILSKPISDRINLSISLSSVPESCKVAKLKPLFKKGSKLEPKNFRTIPISKVLE